MGVNRLTVLKSTGCDLKRLPLGAREAFFLAQIDGSLSVEEVAEIVGLEIDEALELAKMLVELGAVAAQKAASFAQIASAAKAASNVKIIEERRPARVDPRAERESIRPQARKSLIPTSLKSSSIKPTSLKRASLKPSSARSSESPRRRSSKGMEKPSSRHLKAVKPADAQAVTTVITKRRSSKSLVATEPKPRVSSVPPPPPLPAEPPPAPNPEAQRAQTATPERIRQLREAAQEIKVQANVELMTKAAETALAANDPVSAANNYRLALSLREDPVLRMKLEEVDARARIVRFEKNIAPAKAAEREERWADAAAFLVRAHEARPDADVAARAANALRRSAGDLERAASLAAQAVSLEPKNANHYVTLAEVQLAAKRFVAAQDALNAASAIAPKDARIKELSAAIAERERGARAEKKK